MTRLKRVIRGFVFPTVLGLFVLTVACDSASLTPSENQQESAPTVTLSGEDYFRGLFFAEGPVAFLFGEVWQIEKVQSFVKSPEEQAWLDEYEDTLLTASDGKANVDVVSYFVDYIHQQDEAFFDDFKNAIISGDHLRIQAAMTGAGFHIRSAASQVVDGPLMQATTPEEIRTLVQSSARKSTDTACVYTEAAIAVAAVAVAVVVLLAFDSLPIERVRSAGPTSLSVADRPSLMFEQGVHYVATHLAVR